MKTDMLFLIFFCLFIITCCFTLSHSVQRDLQYGLRNQRQVNLFEQFTGIHNDLGGLQLIEFSKICDGRSLIALGACSNTYVRCTYDRSNHYISANTEKCPLGKIFDGLSCVVGSNNCFGTWTQQIEAMNAETEKLLEEIGFCHRGAGIYVSLTNYCSRQAYVCRNRNQGSTIMCPPGMVLLWKPFGCVAYPPECAPGKITLEKFASLRNYAIEKYCSSQYPAKQNFKMTVNQKLQCKTWYVECSKSVKDIVYCENEMIYDEELGRCRVRWSNDRCIMPNLCRNRNWETVSLGNCNRHFVYCRGQVPEEFVCAEGLVFFNGKCIAVNETDDRCWKCRNGEKRHTPFHSCREYSICANGMWTEQNCPSGMSYFEVDEACRPDPSCALPVKCKTGKSYNLKCNEYMICDWKGEFEHRVCPPFYRWDAEVSRCLPDNDCLPSSLADQRCCTKSAPPSGRLPEKEIGCRKLKEESCTKGEIIDSFDCEFYYECIENRWNKKSCPKYSNAEICTKCPQKRSANWLAEEQCMDGDAASDPQDCTNYALCEGGRWRSARCGPGRFWNQEMRQCVSSDSHCKTFKRADCIHGQRLIGKACNEYLECIHGSWITMQCMKGYAFNTSTKRCDVSQSCASLSHGKYLRFVDDGIIGPSTILEPAANLEAESSPTESASSVEDNSNFCIFGSTIRDEHDCSRYYECTAQGYKVQYCENDYEFNEQTGRCEKEYRCDLSRCIEGRTIESEICGHYQICLNGIRQNAICENNGRFANGRCQTERCGDDESISKSYVCRNGYAVADETNCKRYFVCRNGRFYEQLCSSGSSFDSKRRYCTRNAVCESKINCAEGEVRADKQDCTAYRVCEEGQFSLHYCPFGLIYNHKKRTCEEGSCIGGSRHDTCTESSGPSGYRADPLNCRKFYQCAHGKWVSKDCPDGLYWNPQLTVCDWSRNVDICKQMAPK